MSASLPPAPPQPALPLYQRIRSDIEDKILSGAWPPGHKMPSEHVLMDIYGCSRMTLNKVLSGMAGVGLIERKRRTGSIVSRPQTLHSAILQIPDLKAEIEARGEAYGYRLLRRERRLASEADRARLGISGRRSILALDCLHLIAGRPFAHEDRIINLKEVPVALDQDFSSVPPNIWLVGQVPWSEAEHRISAAGADEALAAELGIEPGTACLVLERRTWGTGEPITAVRLTHPGALYDLSARFRPTL